MEGDPKKKGVKKPGRRHIHKGNEIPIVKSVEAPELATQNSFWTLRKVREK